MPDATVEGLRDGCRDGFTAVTASRRCLLRIVSRRFIRFYRHDRELFAWFLGWRAIERIPLAGDRDAEQSFRCAMVVPLFRNIAELRERRLIGAEYRRETRLAEEAIPSCHAARAIISERLQNCFDCRMISPQGLAPIDRVMRSRR